VNLSAVANPEMIKALLDTEEVKDLLKDMAPIEHPHQSKPKKKKEAITVTNKFDKYEQFTGIVITVTHPKLNNGKRTSEKKTFSIRANGRSLKETAIEAEEEVLRLKKRFHIA
jgi:hypothetical protein